MTPFQAAALAQSHTLKTSVRKPIVTGRWSHVAQISSNWRTKFQKPTAHGFVGDIQSPFRQ